MNPLQTRTTSGFPLSIATGMAMETLFTPQQQVYDPGRVAPPRITVSSYQELWVNVLTLIRNAYNACDRALYGSITPHHMVEVITQEMDVITDLLKIEGKDFTTPVFFFNSYKSLIRRDDKVFKLREDKTPLQHQARFIYDKTRDLITRQDDKIEMFDLTLKSKISKKALILTHIPADLLSHRQFDTLDMLESHTGKIKKKMEWNTKYHPCGEDDLGRLPFCRQLLTAFGDQSLIVPIPVKARREILALAEKQRWTPATSVNKVSGDLSFGLTDPVLAATMRTVPIF